MGLDCTRQCQMVCVLGSIYQCSLSHIGNGIQQFHPYCACVGKDIFWVYKSPTLYVVCIDTYHTRATLTLVVHTFVNIFIAVGSSIAIVTAAHIAIHFVLIDGYAPLIRIRGDIIYSQVKCMYKQLTTQLPWMHGIVAHSSTSVSQWIPKYPGGHVQLNAATKS